MKHIRIAGGDSFKLGAAMGVPLILAMVGAASRLADADSASPTAGVTPDKVKAALPELEKLVKDTLKKPGVPGIAVAAVYQDQSIITSEIGLHLTRATVDQATGGGVHLH